jgi:hypothetical protein
MPFLRPTVSLQTLPNPAPLQAKRAAPVGFRANARRLDGLHVAEIGRSMLRPYETAWRIDHAATWAMRFALRAAM